MKYIYFYFCILTVATIATSCDSFLSEDPKGALTEESLFMDENGLDMAITGMYQTFRNVINATENQLYMWCGDDVTSQNTGNKTRFAEYDRFYYNSGNTNLYTSWSNYYVCIKACNNIINNGEAMEIDRTFIEERIGQAYFYRALQYFYLVRLWGSVPLVTDVEVDYETPRASVEAVYELIEADLAKAEAYLPDNHTVSPYSKNGINVSPNKAAAKALLASVSMTQAGWPLKKGAAMYDKAAAKYKEIIDNKATYGYELEPDIRTLVTNQSNYSKEIVLGGFLSFAWWEFASASCEFPEEAGGWCDLLPPLDFFYDFPEGRRKEAYFFTTIYIADAGELVPWDSPRTNQRHPHYKKNVDNSTGWIYDYDTKSYTDENHNWGQGDKTRFLFRYADILLLYAEAVAFGSGAITSEVVDCVLQVQNRAEVPDDRKVTNGMSREAFQKAVLDERRWETCGNEQSVMGRFFTMQRHEILHLQGNYRITNGDLADTSLNPAFASLTGASEQFYYFPIPDQEKLIVPDL
ncbi:MAG: RagB/SusD family nutrient uptake outer membrane protein [Tannerellaceae bacterium]|nr:RagB/SusD family nutrient uptake outer membrane protein [Tannerellaceae bacterium]